VSAATPGPQIRGGGGLKGSHLPLQQQSFPLKFSMLLFILLYFSGLVALLQIRES